MIEIERSPSASYALRDALVSSPDPSAAQKRKVAFSPKIQLIGVVPAISDFTQEEIEANWYTENEFELIRKAYLFIVKLMEKTRPFQDDDEELCSRGLESRTRDGARRRKRDVETAIDAVLSEQERQWEGSFYNAKQLATVYRQATAQACMAAYVRAQKDERIAQELNKPLGYQVSLTPKPSPSKRRSLPYPDRLQRQGSLRSCS